MKVLFITHHFLDKNGGGSFASRAYINAFAEIASEMTLVFPENGNTIFPYINPKVQAIGVKNRKTRLGKIIDIYRGRIHRYTCIFAEIYKTKDPDLVIFDNSRTTAGIIKKVSKEGINTITIHHNYEIEYYLGSPPHWLYKKVFLYHLRKAEQDSIKFSSLNLTLTDEDINLLQKNYDKEKKYNFHKIGCFEYQVNDNEKITISNLSDKLTFVISGNLSAYQTEASLIPFFHSYYPLLLKQYPNCKLFIAGKNPTSRIQRICSSHKNIELVPNPSNMNEIIQKGDIYICPISVGGGLKLRVMDGFKAGLPVITHQVSARGYDIFKKEEIMFVYHDLVSFTIELNNIVNNYRKNLLMKNHIINIFHQNFSFKSGVTKVREIIKLLEQK